MYDESVIDEVGCEEYDWQADAVRLDDIQEQYLRAELEKEPVAA